MTMQRSSPGHAALRQGRRTLAGQAYLLTTSTHRRHPWLEHHDVAAAVARELDNDHLWRKSELHAWVIMPDHMHALVTLEGSETLSRLMARIKAVTARTANQVLQRRPPFWARGFHDHALRSDENIATAARYIVVNPVRAGLVDDPWQWPFWKCCWPLNPNDPAP
ncbi:MAG TPA: transposase [Oleiagrimonas sp.]|nr:transposase [Oleiagrimonas sp.]